jgi:hypothetical protein
MFFLSLILVLLACESPTENLLEHLMRKNGEFADVLAKRDRYEIQIIYTQIDRDNANYPEFTTHTFNVDSTRYFYPASTVKLPAVLLAIEKINELKGEGLDLDRQTPMFHDSAYSGHISASRDTTSESGFPSVEHYCKKILVVSDNDAFNRLYEFLGQKEFNRRMKELAFHQTRIVHRLERPLSTDENRHTEAVRFLKDGNEVYHQPMQVNDVPFGERPRILKGNGFMRNDSLVMKPFDFTNKNFFPLNYQHELLKHLVFPETVPQSKQFRITKEDRAFILQYMSQLPRETSHPAYYSDTAYYDAYCKFLLFGSEKNVSIPPSLRIFNKVGDAYGYLIDNAYVADFDRGIEFMLSAVIHVNSDSIYNDSNYDYEAIGFPFMKKLGQTIYQYELQRSRRNKPDLSNFRFTYDR